MVDEQLLLIGHFVVRRKAIQSRCMMPSSLLISCVHIGNRYFQINGNSAPAGRIVVLCGTIPAKGRSGASILPVSTKLNKLKVGTDGIGRDGGVTSAVFFCRRSATDGPGHLRFWQGFRARSKTFLRLGPVPRPHVISPNRK